MIRYVDADPALLAAVDDRSPHRRVRARAASLAWFGTIWYSRARV